MAKSIPRPSILDKFEYLGVIAGARRWRSHGGQRLYTWGALHGEVEVFNGRGRHLGTLDAVTGAHIKLAVAKEGSMSSSSLPFIALAVEGRVLPVQIDDFVDRWHEEHGGLHLHDFLGLTTAEYALWLVEPDMLSVIVKARADGIPLPARVSAVLERHDAGDAGRVERLDRWLAEHRTRD